MVVSVSTFSAVHVGLTHRARVSQERYWDWGRAVGCTRGWRATFYTTGMEHSPTSATGTGWERTPWHAVQSAAWEALKKVGLDG